MGIDIVDYEKYTHISLYIFLVDVYRNISKYADTYICIVAFVCACVCAC